MRLSKLKIFFLSLGFPGLSAVLSAQAPAAAAGPVSAAPSAAQFAPYRSVVELNIFDASRVGRITPTVKTAPPPLPPPNPQTITLVGILESGNGKLAFFDSSEVAFRKVLPVGESLSEFHISEINSTSVTLAQGDDLTQLELRQQLNRTPDSPWQLSAIPIVSAPPPSSTAGAVERPPPSVPSNASDALKRLMERRRQKTQNP